MEYNKDTNKDGKKETNNKENKPIKMKEMSEIKPINIDIYIISCFNTYIWDKEGYNNSLVFIYACDDQGIFEVGEVSNANLKNVYPYAMALKRCFDRVVLKVSRLAYAGVYSDSEAEEFKRPDEDPALQKADKQFKVYSDQPQPVEGVNYMKEFMDICSKYGLNKNSYAQAYKLNSKSTNADFFNACQTLKKEIEG